MTSMILPRVNTTSNLNVAETCLLWPCHVMLLLNGVKSKKKVKLFQSGLVTKPKSHFLSGSLKLELLLMNLKPPISRMMI